VNRNNGKTVDYTNTFTDVTGLDINNSTGKLVIKPGTEFKVEAEKVTDDFVAEVENNGTLRISDNDNNVHFLWFNFNGFNSPNSKITVYLPEGFVAEEALIETGAGSVTVEGLHTDYLMISAGAGSINGRDISANEVKIDGGVGSVSLNHINFNDSDLNCGVGSLNIEGVLTGKSKLDCGVGEVELHLTGNVEDYDFDVDSSIGTVRVNGNRVRDGYKTDNDAANSIKVDGGIGNVTIDIGQ
jgi:DUF4097 and DUF4098 domain-containing protein YvlB